MSSMKKTKEGINLKKLLRLKNTGSIFVIAGLLMILVIASYTYILQSSYTKTALETEITREHSECRCSTQTCGWKNLQRRF